MTKQITAVEWLESQMTEYIKRMYKPEIEQAKEMEKSQHRGTFDQSRLAKIFEKDMPPIWESFEQYYNETFNEFKKK